MKENKKKVLFTEKMKCPYCKKKILVKKTKKLIEPAVPAEYEEKVFAEKDSQKTLNEIKK